MEPAKVFTREDIKNIFKFRTLAGVDTFLDSLALHDTPEFEVMSFMGERVLVIDEQWYDKFCTFMHQAGYETENPESD
jgi:hypothetical protein